MKLTESQLRALVREEILNKRSIMTEARANEIANEILEEGPIWDLTKSMFAGLSSGVKTAARSAGEKVDVGKEKVANAVVGAATAALNALKPVGAAINNAATNASKVASSVSSAISQIKDDALKNALSAAEKSMKDSLRSTLQKEISVALQSVSKFEKDEKAAKAWVLAVVNAATMSLLSSST